MPKSQKKSIDDQLIKIQQNSKRDHARTRELLHRKFEELEPTRELVNERKQRKKETHCKACGSATHLRSTKKHCPKHPQYSSKKTRPKRPIHAEVVPARPPLGFSGNAKLAAMPDNSLRPHLALGALSAAPYDEAYKNFFAWNGGHC